MYPKKNLADILKRGANNFDIFRLIAAMAVIVGHAYAISPQPPLQDGILSLLHFDYSGSLAVKFFFFLSGLLVTNSIISKPNPFYFLAKRALRIFPGLLVCLLVAVFLVGPVFTKSPLGSYFSSGDTWEYIYKNFFLTDMQWKLTDVFSDSKYGLNGSLWTLPYEVLCYLYLAVFFGLGFLKNKTISTIFFSTVIIVSFIIPNYLPAFFYQNPEARLLPACFALGALFATNKQFISISVYQLILIWLLAILLRNSEVYQFLFYAAFFYSIIFLSSLSFVINRLKVPFDASYGVYVYGFMIQQCMHSLFPNMELHTHQLISAIIALAIGILSWYFVEKRFIELGNNVINNDSLLLFKNRVKNYIDSILLASKNKKLFKESDFFGFFFLFFLAFLVHATVLKFIYPGYYSPLYPQHSDFYIPAAFANSSYSFISLFSWPRPVNMIFAKLSGYSGIYGSIACVIAVVLMNCSMAALLVKRMLNLAFNWQLIALFSIYCYLLFSQPYFYIFYAQDAGAQLSLFLLLSGLYCFYSTFHKPVILGNSLLFCFCLLAFLSKETYGLSALAVSAIWFLYYRKTSFIKGLLPSIAVGLSLAIAFIVNVFIHSTFIDVNATATSPYYINLSPAIFLSQFFLYIKEAINLANFITFFLLVYLYFKDKNPWQYKLMYITVACFVGAIVSWIPNALLPNHHYKGYSFNGAYLLYLPLIFLSIPWMGKNIRKGVFLLIILLCMASPLLNISKYKDNTWVLIQEDTQRNLLNALDPLIKNINPSKKNQKILIEGITFPFHPFAFPNSLRVFPNAQYADFDVVNYNQSLPNSPRTDLVKFIYPADTSLINYQEKWVFDRNGNLVRLENAFNEKILKNPTNDKGAIQINVQNLAQFTTTGFYIPENGIAWTNGKACISLISPIENKDTVLIELNTYLPPICKNINPKLVLSGPDNKLYEPILTTRKKDVFYYLFLLDTKTIIKKISILSDIVDASPDQRVLSFPFVSIEIKK